MNGLKEAYSRFTQALTKPIPFWASPIGLLIIVVLFWVISLIIEPILLIDDIPDHQAIASVRLWLADKVFYFLVAAFAALLAQNLLHKNALKREAMLAKARSSQELEKDFLELRTAVEDLERTPLESLPNKTVKLHNKFRALILKANSQDNPIHIGKGGLEEFEKELSNAIEILCKPIPEPDYTEKRGNSPTVREVFDQMYTKDSVFSDVRDGFVAHEAFVSRYRGKLHRAYSTLWAQVNGVHSYYQSIAHRI